MNEDLETIIREVYSCYDVRYGNAIVDLKQRIDKAIEYIEKNEEKQFGYNFEYWLDDEIKELLDILKGSDKMTYEELVNSGKSIGNMTNDELITYCNGLLEEIWEYDERFDKAIEYLKENACYTDNNEFVCDLRYDNCEELLDILKGSDKE